MTQFDARMGFAPALLCIEEEPLKKTVPVAALKPHPKQKEFDAFAKGNHIGGMIAGLSVGVDLASMVAQDINCSIGELTFYTNGQSRSIFRGANDKENKTATEIKLRIDAVQNRLIQTILGDMGISRAVLKPSGLSGLLNEQLRQEEEEGERIRMLTKEKCDAAAALANTMLTGDWGDYSPFNEFKAAQVQQNPGLADVNTKLAELSGGAAIQGAPGETLQIRRYEPPVFNERWVNGR